VERCVSVCDTAGLVETDELRNKPESWRASQPPKWVPAQHWYELAIRGLKSKQCPLANPFRQTAMNVCLVQACVLWKKKKQFQNR
jgi:hypothetical protein